MLLHREHRIGPAVSRVLYRNDHLIWVLWQPGYYRRPCFRWRHRAMDRWQVMRSTGVVVADDDDDDVDVAVVEGQS